MIAPVDQVLHDRIADLTVLGRSADHCHSVGLHDAVHLRHDLLLTEPMARGNRIEVEHDAYVGGCRAVLRGEHGVQIHFRYLRKVRHQRRHALNHICERGSVHGWRTAYSAQNFRGGDAIQHRQCVFL